MTQGTSMNWEFWVLVAFFLFLYTQHRRVTTRRRALELSVRVNQSLAFPEKPEEILARAALYEHYVHNGVEEEKVVKKEDPP